MKISGCLLFVSTSCWVWSVVHSKTCFYDVYGPDCKFKCHCKGDKCEHPYATCQQGIYCWHGYFGPGCNYRENLEAVSSGANIPDEVIDDNDSSCVAAGTKSISMIFNQRVQFTWMRVTSRPVAASIVQAIELSFDSGIPCDNKKVYLSGNTAHITCDVSIRYRVMKVAGAITEQLCTINLSRGRNIALGQATNQTGTYGNKYFSSLAVDGNFNDALEIGSCSLTRSQSNSRWSLFFDHPSIIVLAYITNRITNKHRLKNFILTTYNVQNALVQQIFGPNEEKAEYEVFFSKGEDITTYVKWLTFLQPSSQLTICEIIVYGDFMCPENTWSMDCSKTCNCAIGQSCFLITGVCDSGCAVGKYGFNCSSSCPQNCLNNICKYRYGDCYSCKPGYLGARCETECPARKYGFECNETCSKQCLTCNVTSGSCTSCSYNYHGENCDLQCPADCSSKQCHRNNGSCLSCREGHYSPKCDSTCPSHCMEHTCEIITGECTRGSEDQKLYWLWLLFFFATFALFICCLWSRARKKPKPEHE